ncbi:prepilin-type N-terminal cleavage/methylation domain-containing protein [Desulfobulbus alkaliphilus]|uniref:prepilin-type N-terminal cleavage/methylation domain-containing protein n=1 Tax=Desulfobulbus alkaliphilus TaxID=869814 RepID=UPI001965E9A9|nr:prepilin-type N-terminal cleavage/methylation domain-containing protein [Desulfobulbus alkaliphilus]
MRNSGFTILEILLAIAVLGMVVTMLSLSLTATLRVIDGTEQQEEVFHQAQTALRRLSEDLAGAAPHPDMGFSGMLSDKNGHSADTLAFVSTAHLIFNPDTHKGGPAAIIYSVRTGEGDSRRLQLLRGDTILLPGSDVHTGTGEQGMYLLADNLRAVRFRYFDRQGQEFDSWNGEGRLDEEQLPLPVPAAVSCTLEFWLDPDRQSAQTFTTTVLIPAGIITATAADED